MPDDEVIQKLIDAGLDSCPGGGAEIFREPTRSLVCANECDADRLLELQGKVHAAGLKTNATMLYGHIESIEDRVDHFVRLREQQEKSGGFQCFIPLAFYPPDTQLAHLPSPTGVDSLKTMAVSRLMLDNFDHIKAYWVMLGKRLAQVALHYGANDIDGTITEGGELTTSYSVEANNEVRMTKTELISLIEDAGFEAAIPFSRWRGFEGRTNPWGSSFDPYAWASALAALTSRIMIFATSHCLTVSPVMAAKQIATIDALHDREVEERRVDFANDQRGTGRGRACGGSAAIDDHHLTLVQVDVGDVIVWQADDSSSFTGHPLESYDFPAGAAPIYVNAGTTYEYTVTVPGTYKYRCQLHWMNGMLGEFTTEEDDTTGAGDGKHIITFGNYFYSPSNITDVAIGDTIEWRGDFSMHPLQSLNVPEGAATFSNNTGTVYQYIVNIEGTYTYWCATHGVSDNMVGSFSTQASSVRSDRATITLTPSSRSSSVQ